LTQVGIVGRIAGEACFRTHVLNFDPLSVRVVSSMCIDVVLCQGPQPLALMLWEEP